VTLHFKGRGISPAERRLSLHQDLAACTSPSGLLDPTSWPACKSLISAMLAHALFSTNTASTHHMRALVNTPSLANLSISRIAPKDFPLLAHISSLSALTGLHISAMDWASDHTAALQAGITPLSRLQHLSLDATKKEGQCISWLSEDDDDAPPLSLHLPSSQHPSLTHVRLTSFSLHSSGPIALGAATALHLHSCKVHGLGALASCPQLARLLHRDGKFLSSGDGSDRTSLDRSPPSALDDDVPPSGAAEEILDDPHPPSLPEGWREGLRCLVWPQCCSSTLAWLEQLQGLTALHFDMVYLSPELFRCVVCCRLQ
jgi:hypothetical protein